MLSLKGTKLSSDTATAGANKYKSSNLTFLTPSISAPKEVIL